VSATYCAPGAANSNLIMTENAVPTSPENNANIRYSVPLEMEPDLSARSPQRTVRASRPAYGSIINQWFSFVSKDIPVTRVPIDPQRPTICG
jgi:hypothetical protein